MASLIRPLVFFLCVFMIQGTKKNVLVMIGDDYGLQASVYGSTCKTPNLDALAKRGLTMTNAYTSVSSCSPSRSAILTGLPQHENGMYGLHHQMHHFESFEGIRSLPKLLNEAKIKTGIIGKKHVGPDDVYPFDFSYTEEHYNLMQVGRNITRMKELAQLFLKTYALEPFFLYIGFHDPHRCGGFDPAFGQFCEKWGDGKSGFGDIPDWNPVEYDPSEIDIPYFLPDTNTTRVELANFYKTISRLDQGVGIMIQALKDYGVLDETLVVFSSDNGIPFPDAKTNLYDPGEIEPFIVSSPLSVSRWGQKSEAMVGLTDIVPTVLDWFGLQYPNYTLPNRPNPITLKGSSVLPLLDKEPTTGWDEIHSSHDFHEITMYYPMRVIRTKQFKLIHNLNFKMPYPIALDIYQSPTFQDILNRTSKGEATHWFKTFDQYYYRDQWELYDIETDIMELKNLANDPNFAKIKDELKSKLLIWQNATNDPWLCSPNQKTILGKCNPLHNEL